MQHSTLSCSRLALSLKLYVLIKYYGLILVVFTDCLGYCLRRKQQIGKLRVDAERQSLDNSLMLQRLAINLGYSVFVALAWVGLWHLNGFLFNAAEVAPLVSLVFLPAILRPMAVLIFGVSGAIGLILGAAVTLPLISPPSLPILLIILSNGLVAWLVLLLLRRIPTYRSELTYDMTGLTLRTIILFRGADCASKFSDKFSDYISFPRSLFVLRATLIYASWRCHWCIFDALFAVDIFAVCF